VRPPRVGAAPAVARVLGQHAHPIALARGLRLPEHRSPHRVTAFALAEVEIGIDGERRVEGAAAVAGASGHAVAEGAVLQGFDADGVRRAAQFGGAQGGDGVLEVAVVVAPDAVDHDGGGLAHLLVACLDGRGVPALGQVAAGGVADAGGGRPGRRTAGKGQWQQQGNENEAVRSHGCMSVRAMA